MRRGRRVEGDIPDWGGSRRHMRLWRGVAGQRLFVHETQGKDCWRNSWGWIQDMTGYE